MEVSLKPRDRAILMKGLEMMVKGCDDAAKKCARLGLATLLVDALKVDVESAQTRLWDIVGEDGALDGESAALPLSYRPASRFTTSTSRRRVSRESAQVRGDVRGRPFVGALASRTPASYRVGGRHASVTGGAL